MLKVHETMVRAGLAPSITQAKKMIKGGGVKIQFYNIKDPEASFGRAFEMVHVLSYESEVPENIFGALVVEEFGKTVFLLPSREDGPKAKGRVCMPHDEWLERARVNDPIVREVLLLDVMIEILRVASGNDISYEYEEVP